jgi:putative endonuclease
MYYTYILQSEADKSYYIGYTTNPEQRLEEHNAGQSRYTSRKTPWKIVLLETYNTKREALKREIWLKKQRNKQFYERLISEKGIAFD